ncbi:MAG: hypothetical protein V1740_03165 [Candidatus Woesearchaeota archaeon]
MTQERIAVFDVLGPAYHYDRNGWIDGAVDPLLERLKKHGYTGKTSEEESRDEEDMIRSGKETPLIMPGFAECVLQATKHRIRPVVVSAGTDWVLEYCIERAAKDYCERTGVKGIRPDQLVQRSDLISTVSIGSKKDPQTWKQAVEKYSNPNTFVVFEDSLPNLVAAMEGLDSAGFHVTPTIYGLAEVLPNPTIGDKFVYRGHMLEAAENQIFRRIVGKMTMRYS